MKKFSEQELLHAMDVAADQYLEFTDHGICTQQSWEKAFLKVPGICVVTRRRQDDPEVMELYYIRGILRKRIPGYFDDGRALQYLRNARDQDVSIDELREIAMSARNWTQFSRGIDEAIAEHTPNETKSEV